jgi:hypothetical protein
MGVKSYRKMIGYPDGYMLKLLKYLPDNFMINMYEIRATASMAVNEDGKMHWYEQSKNGRKRILLVLDGGDNGRQEINSPSETSGVIEGPFRKPSNDAETE